jgi:regulator of extracellular matrix RemA (YlzA/DUF370 family)
MAQWITVGKGGVLAVGRIVAVAQANSAPIRRLVEAVGRERFVDLTFGQPRRSVAVLDSGHVVAVSLTPETLLRRLVEKERNRERNREGDQDGE